MSLCVREVPFNWRRATQGVMSFDIAELRCSGTKPVRTLTVFVPANSVVDLIEMRDWLHEHAISYSMFGRFSYQDFRLRIERTFEGLSFRFADSVSAVHFALRWAGLLPNEPGTSA